MKRIVCILMIIMMMFIFAACGDANGGDSAASGPVSYNETISTKNWEFSFTKVGVGGNLTTTKSADDYMMPGNEDTTVTYFDGGKYVTAPRAYVADSEHTYVAVHFRVKYLGKEKVNTTFDNLYVEFGDGYTFSDIPYVNEKIFVRGNNALEYSPRPYIDIEPLSDEMDIIKVFIVPKKVETETSTSLKVVAEIDGETYSLDVR